MRQDRGVRGDWRDNPSRRAAQSARSIPFDRRQIRRERLLLAVFLASEILVFALGQWTLAVGLLIPVTAKIAWWSADQRRQVLKSKS